MDVSKIFDIKLEGKSNWLDWKADVLTLLRYKEVIGVIDGTIKKPDPIPPTATPAQLTQYESDMKVFTKADTCAILVIRSTLSQEVRALVRMCPDDAKLIWKELCNNFEKKSDVRFCKLNQDFYRAHQLPTESVLTFVARIRTLWAELQREYEAEQNMKLPEILLINKILSELPEEYTEFQTTWDGTTKAERTIEELINRLELRESRFKLVEEEKSVMMNKMSMNKMSNQGGKYENKHRRNFNSESERDKINSDGSFRFRCFKCNKFAGHMAKDCQEQEEDEGSRKTKLLLSFNATVSKTIEDIWIKDDGATDHMTNCNTFFKNYKPFEKPVSIIVGDGSCTLSALGQGDIDMRSKVNGKVLTITFTEVMYVPGLIRNCFSSVKAMSRGISHVGDSRTRTATFYSESDGEVLMEGKVRDGHFELQVLPIDPKKSVKAYVAQRDKCIRAETRKSLKEWHEILCHQGKKYVEQFLTLNNIKFLKEEFFCEPCVYGKLTRRTFKSRSIRAQSVGEIIHADLCEPEQPSMGGNKYFLVMKDDYSKFRHVYLMKNKSDTYDKIRSFIMKAERNGINVKEVLTDGGREFNNQLVNKFLAERGIQLRISMPYTHEQNGAAERENRILVEMARTMLKAADLPKGLWGEAVSTGAYVLNLTGKSSVEGKSPYELWCGKSPSIKHLRRFGSSSYVHVPNQRRKKFDPKSVKGILIGYAGYDGYRIYIPSKKDVVLSTNVIFNDYDELWSRRGESKGSLENEGVCLRRSESDNMSKEIQSNRVELSSLWSDETDVCNGEGEEAAIPQREGTEVANNEDHSENVARNLRPRENLKPPDRYQAAMLVTSDNIEEPLTYSEALKSVNNAQWQEAMKAEMTSLRKNNTWVLVDVPKDKKAFNSRWVTRSRKMLGLSQLENFKGGC